MCAGALASKWTLTGSAEKRLELFKLAVPLRWRVAVLPNSLSERLGGSLRLRLAVVEWKCWQART